MPKVQFLCKKNKEIGVGGNGRHKGVPGRISSGSRYFRPGELGVSSGSNVTKIFNLEPLRTQNLIQVIHQSKIIPRIVLSAIYLKTPIQTESTIGFPSTNGTFRRFWVQFSHTKSIFLCVTTRKRLFARNAEKNTDPTSLLSSLGLGQNMYLVSGSRNRDRISIFTFTIFRNPNRKCQKKSQGLRPWTPLTHFVSPSATAASLHPNL